MKKYQRIPLQVRPYILMRYGEGELLKNIAKRYDLKISTVHNVVKRSGIPLRRPRDKA